MSQIVWISQMGQEKIFLILAPLCLCSLTESPPHNSLRRLLLYVTGIPAVGDDQTGLENSGAKLTIRLVNVKGRVRIRRPLSAEWSASLRCPSIIVQRSEMDKVELRASSESMYLSAPQYLRAITC